MKTKPRGIHATFESQCFKCAGNVTVTNGRLDPHTCQDKPVSLADIRAALDGRT